MPAEVIYTEKSQNIITGIADEASEDFQPQIEIYKSLRRDYIELRNIDEINISRLSDKIFDSFVFRYRP